MEEPVCAVLGVGPGNGATIVRAFAGAGHAVAMLARRASLIDALAAELSGSMATPCDLGQPDELAQAMDRHLGPAGIHVLLLIVDGPVQSLEARARDPERPVNRFINPEAMAAAAPALTRQRPSARTFEMGLRPAGESW
jgi:hypothetical protein